MAKLLPPTNVREAECRNCNYCHYLQPSEGAFICIRGDEEEETDIPFCREGGDDYASIHTTVCDGFKRKE